MMCEFLAEETQTQQETAAPAPGSVHTKQLLLFSSSGEYSVTTIAGDGGYGYRDGEGSQAQFNQL